jgi:HD-like signal output (HDOD) protein
MPFNCMTTTASATDQKRHSALEAILVRLRECSGFPTLSSTIIDINRSVSSNSDSARQLTKVILRDLSLTTKLLQVVNSATYGQYRGRICTISKAVLILGFDAVRNVAMALMMLEFSKGRPQEKALQDELVGAFFAGAVSKPLAQRLGVTNVEETVICTMFQSLGRLLVIFFLYEESRKVAELAGTGVSEDQASEKVLGISYCDLGIGVAQHWNFPDRLIEGMQRLASSEVATPRTDIERLKIAANLGNDLYVTALRCSEPEKTEALQALSKRYAATKLEPKDFTSAIDFALKEIEERATTLNLPVANSAALKVIRVWNGGSADADERDECDAPRTDDTIMQGAAVLDAWETESSATPNIQQILSEGIHDVSESLTGEFQLNDLLQMVLETMYRGMGFTRTMIFVRDAKLNAMRARFGFGTDIERIIQKCSFSMAFAPDVFHVSIDKGVDIAIENTEAGNIAQRIPQWHREAIKVKSFLLLPVMLKSRPLALLYADSEHAEPMKISPEQLSLLRTLRSQVVLAFKQCAAQ